MNESSRGETARQFTVARRTNGYMTAHALKNLDNIADAYRVQDQVRDELGAKVVGWKLAAPPSGDVISAPLFDMGCLACGAVVENAEVLRDGVECELALRIDRSLPGGGCTREDVMAAVDAVMPAFELLCSRLPLKFASPREHIVADGMGQGPVVLGVPCRDWRTLELDKLRVTLWSDDALVVDKYGGNPFGDPLLAVALLADHLARRRQALAAGTFVLAGSHTGVYRARPGERLRCVFEGVGQVGLTLHKGEEQKHAGR
jgi:2-keto-4-pentenoate hydratase